MKKIMGLLAVLTVLISLSACGSSSDDETHKIKMAGSTSVEKVAKALGEAYSEKTGDEVMVEGGGSSAGVPAVVEGRADIGSLSRELKEAELEENLTKYVIAIDGIAICVNGDNPVDDLTLQQIADIYTGKINNWSEVGGSDMEIVVIAREDGSGTRDGFESITGIKDLDKDHDVELAETGQVVANCNSTAGAIGYISTGYIAEADKCLTVGGIKPTVANIQAGTYPLQRNFNIVIHPNAEEYVTDFINYILSDEGQKIVLDKGYVPVN